MLTNIQTWTVIGLASLIWLVLSIVGLVAGGPADVLTIADILPFLLLGASVFERWLWRWGPLHPHVVGTPVLVGTWRGTLASEWTAISGAKPEPKTVYLAVEQTLTTVNVRLFTDESQSEQIAGSVSKVLHKGWVVSYTYLNTPVIGRREGSPIHHGGTLIAVIDGQARSLDGEYWTDRKSKGSLVFDSRVSHVAQSFGHAQSFFLASASPTASPGH